MESLSGNNSRDHAENAEEQQRPLRPAPAFAYHNEAPNDRPVSQSEMGYQWQFRWNETYPRPGPKKGVSMNMVDGIAR